MLDSPSRVIGLLGCLLALGDPAQSYALRILPWSTRMSSLSGKASLVVKRDSTRRASSE